MSTASALLSLITPAVPATPHGSVAADASAAAVAFEGLLASMLGGDMTGDGQGEAALPTETTDGSDLAATVIVPTPAPALASQPLLLISGTDLSTLSGETLPETPTVAAAAPEPEASPVVPTEAPALSESVPADAAVTKDASAAPTQPLTQPVAPPVVNDTPTTEAVDGPAPSPVQPQADTAVPVTLGTPAPVTPLPVDKTPVGKTADTGPQVRPAVKAGPEDDIQVQPLAPTEPSSKTATAEPLVRPSEPSVGDDMVTPIPAPIHRRRLTGELQPRQTDLASDATVTPGRSDVSTGDPVADAGAKATVPTPLTQPPVAPDVAPNLTVKAAPVTEARPQVQPPAPSDAADAPAGLDNVAADTLKASGTLELTEAFQPSPTETDRKAAEAPRPPETPNLRALAERASRPVETNAAVDTAAPSTPVTTTPQATAASTPTAATAAGTPLPAAEAAAAAVVTADIADPAADPLVEQIGLDAAPSAQAAQETREALPPTLSRVAIEATAQIAAQILKRLDGRSTRFEMSLTPDELGRVDVKLEIDAEGRLAARLAFDNPAAATDLKGRADELRRQLEQQGFHLAEDAFEFTQRDSGSSAFDRGQDSRQSQDRAQSRAFAAASRLNTEADAVAQPPRWTALSLTPAGVDLKV